MLGTFVAFFVADAHVRKTLQRGGGALRVPRIRRWPRKEHPRERSLPEPRDQSEERYNDEDTDRRGV